MSDPNQNCNPKFETQYLTYGGLRLHHAVGSGKPGNVSGHSHSETERRCQTAHGCERRNLLLLSLMLLLLQGIRQDLLVLLGLMEGRSWVSGGFRVKFVLQKRFGVAHLCWVC